MDFTSIKPILTQPKPLESRELERAIRLSISAEHDAAHLYETIADSVKSEKVKKLFQDIANEEKVHIGEFEQVLNTLNKKNKELVEEGKDEAMKKMSSISKVAFYDELEKIALSKKTIMKAMVNRIEGSTKNTMSSMIRNNRNLDIEDLQGMADKINFRKNYAINTLKQSSGDYVRRVVSTMNKSFPKAQYDK